MACSRAVTALFALSLLGAACGGTTGEAAGAGSPPAAGAGAGGEGVVPDAGAADPRLLPERATFGDLVVAARTLDDRGEEASVTACLLGVAPAGGHRLAADVAVAVRPLADPPARLDSRLDGDTGPVRVLSRWGSQGDAGRVAVAVFTSAPPPAPEGAALVVFVAPEGIYLRATDGPVGAAHGGPFPFGEVERHVEAALSASTAVDGVVVTATADLSLSRLRTVLEALPAGAAARLSLGVVLAEGTRLPAPVAPRSLPEGDVCPDGLPEPATDAPEGDLPPDAFGAALAPLGAQVAACTAQAGPRGARGGRLVVLLRVGPDGRVARACLAEDEVEDPAVTSCALEAVRALTFPAPSPAGFVDAALPLRLAADAALRQSPVCD